MNNTLQLTFELGMRHILAYDALDHLLFLLALAIPLSFKHWKIALKLSLLFAVGHTASMVAVVMNWIAVPDRWIELLIPITILLTGLVGLTKWGDAGKPLFRLVLAGLFGLIHGLGFGRFYSMLNDSESLGWGILGFVGGLEVAQLAVLLAVLILDWILVNGFHWPKKNWNNFFTGGVVFLSLFWTAERFFASF
jgi:hypothetical protein